MTLLFILIVATLTSKATSQAPGDEDNRCTVDHTSPQVYPDTVRNLMDSYNYEQLLPGNGTGNSVIQSAVWNDRSYDENDETNRNSPTYWQHGAGGICRYQTTVCGWRREGALQNNWLFTQHIHKDFDPNIYNYPVEIHVEIIHALKSCRERLGCHPRVYVHNYITNTVQLPSTEGAGFMNTQHYTELGVLHPPEVSLTYDVTLNFTLQPSQTGFYIAVRDNGTCFGISRVQVYRDNCKSFQSGLVLYPDAPAPVSDSVNINIQCVDNADVSGSAQVTCGSDGRWGPQNPVCQCRLGYEDRRTKCVACPAGEYRSAGDSTCQQCPDNTVRDQVAAPLCECLDGYFRNNENRLTDSDAAPFLDSANESSGANCTQPPEAPRNLAVSATSAYAITARWTPPAELGGRDDLFYKAEHSDPDNLGSFTGTVYKNEGDTSHTFTGLTPYTQYCVRVTAHNGVSDQDPDGTHLRTVEECTETPEAKPGPVAGVEGHCSVVVWNEPKEPNGRILNYTLVFIPNTGDDDLEIQTADDRTSYVIRPGFLLPEGGGLYIQVRAHNGAGAGDYSQLAYIGCEDPPGDVGNVTVPPPPPTTPESLLSDGIELVNDMIVWRRPNGRISYYNVTIYDDKNNVVMDLSTNEQLVLLSEDILENSYFTVEVCPVLHGVQGNCTAVELYREAVEEPTTESDDVTSKELVVVAAASSGGTALVVGCSVLLIAVIHHWRFKKRFGPNKEALTWEDYKIKG